MYNPKHLARMEAFSRDLWGESCVDSRAAAYEASRRGYVPQADSKIVPCYKNSNGEWVPSESSDLEDMVV